MTGKYDGAEFDPDDDEEFWDRFFIDPDGLHWRRSTPQSTLSERPMSDIPEPAQPVASGERPPVDPPFGSAESALAQCRMLLGGYVEAVGSLRKKLTAAEAEIERLKGNVPTGGNQQEAPAPNYCQSCMGPVESCDCASPDHIEVNYGGSVPHDDTIEQAARTFVQAERKAGQARFAKPRPAEGELQQLDGEAQAAYEALAAMVPEASTRCRAACPST